MAEAPRLVRLLDGALGHGPAYVELADALRALVLDGRVVVGERLPAERRLADQLGLSRTTVTTALTMLRAEGYLRSRQGSGTVVALPPDLAERPDERAPDSTRPDLDLTIASMPAPGVLAPAAMRAATRLPALLSGTGLHPLGLTDLRIGLARWLSRRGLPTVPAQLLITQGSLHAWDLVLRAFAAPGTAVAIEQPTYPAAIDAALAHRVRPVPFAVDAAGWALPAAGLQAPIVHVVPDFQNPTGHLADEPSRRALLRATRGSTVVVDETFAALHVGDPVVPTAALRRDVLTAGSLSKHVWAGLRIGWLRGPEDVVTRLAVARTTQDLAAPVLEQLVALELLEELDVIAADRVRVLGQRRDHLVGLVRDAGWEVSVPAGGMFLWAGLGSVSSTRLTRAAWAHGVRVTPGPRFSVSGTHDRFLRLPFTHPEPVLDDAMRRLRLAASSNAAAGRRPVPRWTA